MKSSAQLNSLVMSAGAAKQFQAKPSPTKLSKMAWIAWSYSSEWFAGSRPRPTRTSPSSRAKRRSIGPIRCFAPVAAPKSMQLIAAGRQPGA
jgi:hypothetical protein